MAEIIELKVRRFNMYGNGKVISFPEEGEKVLLREQIVHEGSVHDSSYTIKNGDELWDIAKDVYKNKIKRPSRYWWIIADVNSDVIFNPYDISDLVGVKLIIPDLAAVELNR